MTDLKLLFPYFLAQLSIVIFIYRPVCNGIDISDTLLFLSNDLTSPRAWNLPTFITSHML
jgi:hypothetical protein